MAEPIVLLVALLELDAAASGLLDMATASTTPPTTQLRPITAASTTAAYHSRRRREPAPLTSTSCELASRVLTLPGAIVDCRGPSLLGDAESVSAELVCWSKAIYGLVALDEHLSI